ncbi:MAG: hypothetical protein EOO61_00195 [Hymenobacter sp.]|nr:MAG: hypothetical protein EOO61_00195 [Hymenobacter sp.]
MSLVEKIQVIDRRILSDDRGYFLKVLTGKEQFLPSHTGEIYVTSAKPNEAKGGHYHPKAKEWFTLLQGECVLKLVDIETGEKLSLSLSSTMPQTVYVPNNIAHIFINASVLEEFLLLAYSDELYDKEDTIYYEFV